MGVCLDDRAVPPQSEAQLAAERDHCGEPAAFPPEVAALLEVSPGTPPDLVWDAFLGAFGNLLLKTARYAHRKHPASSDAHDASMDAYAFILEKLGQDNFRRLRAFSGGDETALTRWLVVVARRLCTDFWRHRYGRLRESTPEVDRDTRRQLVDEIWDPRDSSEFPTPKTSDPEWELRFHERRSALEAVIGGLKSRDRLLLAFRFEEDLSARHIAELMDFPTPFHVYRQLNRVLAVLRKELEGRGIGESDP